MDSCCRSTTKEEDDFMSDHWPEFSNAQLERIDEVENAAFDFIKVLTEQPDLDWDMSLIGEIADMAADFLVSHGHQVRFPARVCEDDEHCRIVDYYNED